MNNKTLTPVSGTPKFGITKITLKYIAIVAMAIDHTAHVLPDGSLLKYVMHFIGRIAAPIMFFSAAEGYQHTKNINRYMARLAIFALISYVPFLYFIAGGAISNLPFFRLNVIYTIFLGVTAIRIRRELKNPVIKSLLIVCLFVLAIPGDFGMPGLLMMLMFDYFYGNFRYQALTYCTIVIMSSDIIKGAISLFSHLFIYPNPTFSMRTGIGAVVSLGSFLPIILLQFYNGQTGGCGRFSKWFFYMFYPLHLIILGLVQSII